MDQRSIHFTEGSSKKSIHLTQSNLKRSIHLTKSNLSVSGLSVKGSFESGSRSEIWTTLQDNLTALETTSVNIGIIGEEGAGKSTLINAIRDLREDEEDAAAPGNVETRKDSLLEDEEYQMSYPPPIPYPHPKYANMVLWKLPSIGTPDFHLKTYLEQAGVSSYDFFLILAAQRFTSCHAEVAQGLKAVGKDFYFVCSKVDTFLDLAHEIHPSGFNEGLLLQKVRESCLRSLQKAGVASPKVFLVSNHQVRKYDFPLLEESLGKGLGPRKGRVFLLATPNTSHRLIETKKSSIQENMWLVSVVASSMNAVPIPDLSIACNWDLLLRTMRSCCVAFGVDEASLLKVAERIAQPFEDLKILVKSPLADEINKFVVEEMLETAAQKVPYIPGEVLTTAAIKDSVAALGSSFTVVYNTLKDFVDEVAADAHRILVKVFISKGHQRQSDAKASTGLSMWMKQPQI